jgi:hypothetical protein
MCRWANRRLRDFPPLGLSPDFHGPCIPSPIQKLEDVETGRRLLNAMPKCIVLMVPGAGLVPTWGFPNPFTLDILLILRCAVCAGLAV